MYARYIVSVTNTHWKKGHRELMQVPANLTESDALIRACVVRRLALRGDASRYKMALYCEQCNHGEAVNSVFLREVE